MKAPKVLLAVLTAFVFMSCTPDFVRTEMQIVSNVPEDGTYIISVTGITANGDTIRESYVEKQLTLGGICESDPKSRQALSTYLEARKYVFKMDITAIPPENIKCVAIPSMRERMRNRMNEDEELPPIGN